MRGAATSTIYWVVVITLFVVSGFFAYRVEEMREGFRRSTGKKCLKSGSRVIIQRAIDGDEVLVRASKCTAVVRVLGIKSFSLKSAPTLQPLAKHAFSLLEAYQGKEVVIFDLQEKLDDRKRHLAKLRDGEQDVGRALVQRGWALVYRRYPFPGMADYLRVEAEARGKFRGLWAYPHGKHEAETLQRRWEQARRDAERKGPQKGEGR